MLILQILVITSCLFRVNGFHKTVLTSKAQKYMLYDYYRSCLFASSSVPNHVQEESTNCNKNPYQEFNPLGPPTSLASLNVGESCKISLMDEEQTSLEITRLSQNPDIFLVPNFLKKPDTLIEAAREKGLKQAGTRRSEKNTIRKDSFLTWIDNDDDSKCGVVERTTQLCKFLFLHESLLLQNHDRDFVVSEEVQVAKYNPKGCFDLHHDGFNRFLTVIHYLNGVGGTYFPLARTKNNASDDEMLIPTIQTNPDGSFSLANYQIGKDGLLIIGEESKAAYSLDNEDGDEDSVVTIQAGDSILFYNYNLLGGDNDDNKEWRSIHAALPVPNLEKWIATNWFRSKELLGPVAHLYRERLLEKHTY